MSEEIQLQGNVMNGRNSRSAAEAAPRGVYLVTIRALWIALALFVFTISVNAAGETFRQMQTICAGNDCYVGLSPDEAQALALLGLPISFIAWSDVFWTALTLLMVFAVATIMFWRQPYNRMAILMSFALISLFPAFYNGLMERLIRIQPGWYWPVALAAVLGIWLSILCLYLFPSGHFVPARARLAMPALTVYAVVILSVTSWFAVLDSNTTKDRLLQFVFWGFLLAGLASQVYRYRRASSLVEQQQTKWVLFAIALFLIEDIAFQFLFLAFPPSRLSQPGRFFYVYIGTTITSSLFLLYILSLAIAILRYRLWDIDIIIRRSLVYVPLTGILAGLFAASVAVLQRVFVTVTGQESGLAAVFSTLLVVAALTPVKDRLQTAVDRRFKDADDPARKLKAFEEQLRTRFSAIDPVQVTRRMTGEAMAAFDAIGGAVFWGGEQQPSYTCGKWDGEIRLSSSLASGEREYGIAALSSRRNGLAYDRRDQAALDEVAAFVAQVIEQDNPTAAPGPGS